MKLLTKELKCKFLDVMKIYQGRVMPIVFGMCMCLGFSFYKYNSWEGCFGSLYSEVIFVAATIIMAALYKIAVSFLYYGLDRLPTLKPFRWNFAERFFESRIFIHSFLFLIICWLPFLILCFPGGLCVDASYQIMQVLGEAAYSTQQPLVHTLLLGGLVKLGGAFGSYDLGLYGYIWLQSFVFAAILALSITYLKKWKIKSKILCVILFIYGLVPVYPNFATMAIKDTLYSAFCLLFVITLVDVIMHLKNWEINNKESNRELYLSLTKLGIAGILTMLFRNNGLYLVGITAFCLCLALLFSKKQFSDIKNRIKIISVVALIAPIILYFVINSLMVYGLSAEKGTTREMLSIPFQQTARYIRDYGDEVTKEEKTVISKVLNNYDSLGKVYNPDISDPVKSLYNIEAGNKDLKAYFKVWFNQLVKHPDCYVQSTANLAYGWFYPGVSNIIRYEADMQIFWKPGIFVNLNTIMKTIYSKLNSFFLYQILQNVGFYTWLLFILTGYTRYHKKENNVLMLVPLYVSLLICIASPGFFLHPRYAFPIMFSIPFLYAFAGGRERNTSCL